MKLSIKKTGGLPYARKEPYEYDGTTYEADIKDGDVVKILDSGETEIGNYGEQTVFKIKTRNGDKRMNFNQSTINVLVQELGEDTENWINKEVRAIFKKDVKGGKKIIIVYLVIGDWRLDDYGALYKEGEEKKEDENDGINIPF